MPPGICQIGLMRFHAFDVTVANANRAALSVKVLKDHLATNSLGVLASSSRGTTCCFARVEGFGSPSVKYSFPFNSPLRSSTWEEGAACSLLHLWVF